MKSWVLLGDRDSLGIRPQVCSGFIVGLGVL